MANAKVVTVDRTPAGHSIASPVEPLPTGGDLTILSSCLLQDFGAENTYRVIAAVTQAAGRAGESRDYSEMGANLWLAQRLYTALHGTAWLTPIAMAIRQQGNGTESPPGRTMAAAV